MSLGSGYDMVLLPPRDNVEPRLEPIPPHPVHGRRSGHHAGGAWRGRHRSRISDLEAEARTHPAPPARSSSDRPFLWPMQCQRKILWTFMLCSMLHGPTWPTSTTPYSAPLASTSTPKGGPRGFDFTAPSHIIRDNSGRTHGYTSCAPLWTLEHSRHLCLLRKHIIECIHGSPRASPKVYA